MNTESSAETSQPRTDEGGQAPDHHADHAHAAPRGNTEAGTAQPATVLVRGETVVDQPPKSQTHESAASPASGGAQKDSPPKKVSVAKATLQSHLPALEDDRDVSVQKDHVVVRDGKADLSFNGTLLAAAAPSSAPEGDWEELRVYETSAGKHVFSKVTRKIWEGEDDEHTAEVFDPSPSSMSLQVLRSARDLTRSKPMTWTDAAVHFFGYEPLAKVLYRKLGHEFEEHIS